MAELTATEQVMFGKYSGCDNLIDDDGFWSDVLVLYGTESKNIVVPVEYSPLTVRHVLGMIRCPVGNCGVCCRYPKTHIADRDVQRIVENTEHKDASRWTKSDEKGLYLDTSQGCPFLKDNVCTIYEHRPDVCYLFPIMGGRPVTVDGVATKQMVMRVKCVISVNAIRTLLKQGLGDKLLLPDLSLVPRYTSEG